jgi:hypothetical protein
MGRRRRRVPLDDVLRHDGEGGAQVRVNMAVIIARLADNTRCRS